MSGQRGGSTGQHRIYNHGYTTLFKVQPLHSEMVVCTEHDRCRSSTRYRLGQARSEVVTGCGWIPGPIDYPGIDHCECNQPRCPSHCLGSRRSADVERDDCLVKQGQHPLPSQIFFWTLNVTIPGCIPTCIMEPSTSAAKRSATASDSPSKRSRQDDHEDLQTYYLSSERGLICQGGHYGDTAFIQFRQRKMDHLGSGEVTVTSVTLISPEITELERELPRAITIMDALITKKNLPAKRHLMSCLSSESMTQMRFLEISVFKRSLVCSVRRFFRKEGLTKPTKDGVTLKVQDLHKLQKLILLLQEDLLTAENIIRQDRRNDEETDRLIREF